MVSTVPSWTTECPRWRSHMKSLGIFLKGRNLRTHKPFCCSISEMIFYLFIFLNRNICGELINHLILSYFSGLVLFGVPKYMYKSYTRTIWSKGKKKSDMGVRLFYFKISLYCIQAALKLMQMWTQLYQLTGHSNRIWWWINSSNTQSNTQDAPKTKAIRHWIQMCLVFHVHAASID